MDIFSIIKDIFVNIFAGFITSSATNPKNPNIIINCPHKHDQNKKEKSSTTNNETNKLSARFQKVLHLMNEGQRENYFNIPKLSKILGLKKISDLEKYFQGEQDPTFEFMENFSNQFGINPKWLQFGDGQAFESQAPWYNDAMDYLDHILNNNPEAIYFVQSKNTERQSFLLLKISEHKYEVLPKYWHISSCVGAGGSWQIYRFYQFVQNIRKTKYSTKCWGIVLGKDDFWKLMQGEVFPAAILDNNRTSNFWWDDFTDLHYKIRSRKAYQEDYGTEFTSAQGIALYILTEEDKKSHNKAFHSEK
ncbi:MAG: hypothetical protein WCZ86_14055 [Desulfurivibrionaceae bacterium]|jgi:hypothetical protein